MKRQIRPRLRKRKRQKTEKDHKDHKNFKVYKPMYLLCTKGILLFRLNGKLVTVFGEYHRSKKEWDRIYQQNDCIDLVKSGVTTSPSEYIYNMGENKGVILELSPDDNILFKSCYNINKVYETCKNYNIYAQKIDIRNAIFRREIQDISYWGSIVNHKNNTYYHVTYQQLINMFNEVTLFYNFYHKIPELSAYVIHFMNMLKKVENIILKSQEKQKNKDKYISKDILNSIRKDFIDIQASVLDINILNSIYTIDPRINNIVIVCGYAHLVRVFDFFKNYKSNTEFICCKTAKNDVCQIINLKNC